MTDPSQVETQTPAPYGNIHEASSLPIELFSLFKAALQSVGFIKIYPEQYRAYPSLVALIVIINALLFIGLDRLTVSGDATFYPEAGFYGWWVMLASLWMCWIATNTAQRKGKQVTTASLFAITELQSIIISTIATLIFVLVFQQQRLESSDAYWVFYGIVVAWNILAYCLVLANVCRASGKMLALFGIICISFYVADYFYKAPEFWYANNNEEDNYESDYLTLSQANLEKQFEISRQQLAELQTERPSTIDLFGISFAPYSAEVFLNESTMVERVMKTRFDMDGHWQTLINQPTTIESKPWASAENLERAIIAAGDKMNRDEDILFIYLTSHGGKDATLSASHWPLELDEITPYNLILWLDKAGIKYRVIVISACYSGSWIKPLQNENTLILTAADATHTSYGCGKESELTYFGRALIDEQLKITRNFEKAFKAAVPVIKQREIEGKKDDGFSNPQISMGAGIRPVLARFESQFD